MSSVLLRTYFKWYGGYRYMLPRSNNGALAHKGINPELVFFYQRWQELLESRTLDTYQYNILNACVACLELYDVVEKTIEGLFISRQNVDDIKAEALEILAKDDVLIKHNKPLRVTLLRIVSSKLDSKQKNEGTEDKTNSFYVSLNRLRYQLQTPINLLHTQYLSYIIRELRTDLDQNNKVQIEKHISMLISQCIYEGWSAKGLFGLSKYLEGSHSFEEKWTSFSEKILTQQRDNFEVYYSIKIDPHQVISSSSVRQIIQDLGINIRKGDSIIDHEPNRQVLYSKIDSEKHYVIVMISATDVNSAALTAINNLNNQLSIATFYNILNPWLANSPQIIVFNPISLTAESLRITDVFKTYDYIDSSNSVFEDTKNLINNPQKKDIIYKLHSAFSYTNLSRTSLFQETKYISLWIAVESIMRTGQYTDIISHVKKVLPATLCTRYVYRIIRNFAEDCIRCGITQLDEPANINMDLPDKKNLVKSLIRLFRNSLNYPVLLQKCQVNELLTYRCQEIHLLLNDNKKILEKLERHKIKIEWHIQRLYRIRNEITHSAFKDDKSLTIYIEHLYTYLSQLISEIVSYIEHKNAKSIEEVYAILGDNFQTFIELLREEAFENKDVLPNGVIDMLGQI